MADTVYLIVLPYTAVSFSIVARFIFMYLAIYENQYQYLLPYLLLLKHQFFLSLDSLWYSCR